MEIEKANNLQEALFLELDKVNIRNPESIKEYLRSLVAKAYMKSENIVAHSLDFYMQDKSIEQLRLELQSLVYMGDKS